ncbi:MAG: DUF4252 domain-containing protein [Bacteroidota bacterium]
MRTLLLSAIYLLVLPAMGQAQNAATEAFYQKYKHLHVETTAEQELQELMASLEKNEDRTSKIESYRVIENEDENPIPKAEVFTLIKALKADAYDVIVRVNDGGSLAYLLTKDGAAAGSLSEFFYLEYDAFEFRFITLSGNINLTEIVTSGYSFSHSINGN